MSKMVEIKSANGRVSLAEKRRFIGQVAIIRARRLHVLACELASPPRSLSAEMDAVFEKLQAHSPLSDGEYDTTAVWSKHLSAFIV